MWSARAAQVGPKEGTFLSRHSLENTPALSVSVNGPALTVHTMHCMESDSLWPALMSLGLMLPGWPQVSYAADA